MNLTDRIHPNAVIAALDATNADTPTEVREAYDTAKRVASAAETIAPTVSIVDTITNALTAGRDPSTDPAVTRALTASQLSGEGLSTMVAATAYERLRETWTCYAVDIVDAWTPAFDDAVHTLEDCLEQLGPLDLNDPAAVINSGGDAAEVWATARKAHATITTINDGWTSLGEFTRTAPTSADYKALRFIDATPDQWDENSLRRRNITPWDALRSGLTLALPTAAEYRDRVRTITDTITARAAARPIDGERAAMQDWAARTANV